MSGNGAVAEAMELFTTGLADTDRRTRMDTATRLHLVAKLLGPDAARGELLGYLNRELSANPPTQEDEVLCRLAKAMDASFLDLIGGNPYALHLLKVLQPLASVTETTVRQAAVGSMVSLASRLSVVVGPSDPPQGDKLAVKWAEMKAMIVSLAGFDESADAEEASADGKSAKKKNESWFPGKLSACRLFGPLYAAMTADMANEKREIMDYLSLLSEDEMPMVRVAAASALRELEAAMTPQAIRSTVISILRVVLEDKADTVRETSAGAIAKAIEVLMAQEDASDHHEVLPELIDLYEQAVTDPSWKVRLAAVAFIADAIKPLPTVDLKRPLISSFADLLDDEEAEVRLASIKKASVVLEASNCPVFNEVVVPTVLAGFREMLEDAGDEISGEVRYPQLRQAQALMCMELASFDAIPHDILVQVVHKMFGDPSLCVSMLGKFKLLIKLKESDPAALQQICMDSLSLATHEDWRVRCAFTAQLSFVFEQIINSNGGSDKDGVERAFAAFKRVIDFAVWDQVAEARAHFIECLPAIMSYADKLGGETYVKQIMGMITDQYEGKVDANAIPPRKTTYLYKINALQAMQTILTMPSPPDYFKDDAVANPLIQILVDCGKDPTPNVRLTAAKGLGAFGRACLQGVGVAAGKSGLVESTIKPLVQGLLEGDTDADVKDAAQVAYSMLEA